MMKKQRNRIQPDIRAKFDRRSGIVRLNVPLSVKADSIDTSERTFVGLAATWDEDLGSDIIHKGAFKKSIATWKTSGEAMPLLNSHDHFDIFAALGQALSMKETDQGLEIKWEVIEGDDGDKVLQRIRPSARTGRAIIGKMSIGFVPSKFEFEQPEGTDSFWDRKRHINEADLKEVSLVLFPMNPNASIDATTVKMFMQQARDTDPRTLDSVTRLELRRLNTRIGLLLKKQKSEDEAEEEDTDDVQQTPSTQTPAPKTPAVDDSDDDADDSEDNVEDSDDLGTSQEFDDDEDDTDETDDSDNVDDTEKTPKSAKTPVTDKKDTKQDEPQPYIYSDALKERLSKIALQRKIGEATAVRDDS